MYLKCCQCHYFSINLGPWKLTEFPLRSTLKESGCRWKYLFHFRLTTGAEIEHAWNQWRDGYREDLTQYGKMVVALPPSEENPFEVYFIVISRNDIHPRIMICKIECLIRQDGIWPVGSFECAPNPNGFENIGVLLPNVRTELTMDIYK